MSPATAINFLPEAFEATLQPCLILRSARSALRRSGCTAKRTTSSQHTFSRLLQKLATQGVEIAFSGQSNILCERAFPANGAFDPLTFPFSPNPTGIPYRYSTLGWGALHVGLGLWHKQKHKHQISPDTHRMHAQTTHTGPAADDRNNYHAS